MRDMNIEERIQDIIGDLFGNITFAGEPAGLYDPLRYMIAIGGKRIRPKLCLTAYSLFADGFGEEILSPAAGLEVFHTFTLIHDDIMDRSPMRRSHPTVWKKWSPDTAILSGDVMCIDSYRRIAKAPENVLGKVLDLFSTTAAEVCEGQQMDMDFETEQSVAMERYMKMIGLKTAVLIACSAKMGALIGGAAPSACEAMYRYGYELGLAFQVADDYLDAYGDPAVFGKPVGGDILNNKKSWLTVRAMEKAGDKAALLNALSLPSDTPEQAAGKILKVKEIYGDLGIPSDAQVEIARLHSSALEAVSSLGDRTAAVLKDFADKLVGRTK